MFPTYGWLSQHHVHLHAAQNCVMRKKEPVMAFFPFVEALAQNGQVAKSILECDSRKGFKYGRIT